MPRSRVISGRSFVRGGGPKRQTRWLVSAIETDFTTLAAGTVLFDQQFGSVTEPFTITRTVGDIMWWSDQTAGLEVPFGALGMAIAGVNAVGAGVASLPAPYADAEFDNWFLWQVLMVNSANDSGAAAGASRVFHFDSKAQRKVEEGESIAVMVENASVTDGALFLLTFRMLIKLA